MRGAACSTCKALIVWAATEKGSAIPVDAKPVANGNLDLVAQNDPREAPIAFMLDKHGERLIGPGVKHSPMLRYQSHFSSCPQADQHRKG
jgi:hypothetical protein